MLPAVSVAVAVSACAPSARVLLAIDQFPDPSAVAVPTAPSISEVNTISLPASAVPEIVGVVLLVRSSSSALPVSLAASRSGVPGAAGAVVSMVTASAAEATLMLSIESVAVAVRSCVPSASALAVMVQFPDPSAVAVPTTPSMSEESVTVLPASAVPETVGVLSLVLSSSAEAPESLPLNRSGALGASGVDVSMVTARAVEAIPVLPAASVAVAVRSCVPSASVLAVMAQTVVVPSAVAVPTVPSIEEDSVTVLPASAVPETVGVVSLVRLSSSAVPESLAADRSGALGASGAVVSTVTASAAEATPVLPAVSVAVAVRLWVPSPSVSVVMLQTPVVPSAVAVPTAPSMSDVTSTVLPASAVPEIVGVVSLVLSSSSALPVSLSASRSGVLGAAGAVVSMVTARVLDAVLWLPAASVDVAVRLWTVSARAPVVIDQFPETSAVVVPSDVEPESSSIDVSASAVPLIVGVSSLVILSLSLPVSLAVARSGIAGAAGEVASIVTTSAVDAVLVLPAISFAVAVSE